MIRIIRWQSDARDFTELDQDMLASALKSRGDFVWVDLTAESPEAADLLFREQFAFHPLSIQDAIHETHAAKLDRWDTYIYLVLHRPHSDSSSVGFRNPPELDIFLGRNFLVTHHHLPFPEVESIWDALKKDKNIRKSGPDHIVYRIAHEIVRTHFRYLERIENNINDIENQIFTTRNPDVLEALFSIKRDLLRERSYVAPMHVLFNQLAIEPIEVIDTKDRVFFRDIYEQVNKLDSVILHLRDLVTSTLDTHLSVINNRMNETMRVMAIITTLFLPITFITGFFGMNFFQAANSSESWTGFVALGLAVAGMVVIPIGMFWWMKRRGLL